MKNLTFSKQLKLGGLIVVVCDIIAFTTQISVFENVGCVLYGLIFLINPVVPYNCPMEKIKKTKIALRICGLIIIYVGITLNGKLLG